MEKNNMPPNAGAWMTNLAADDVKCLVSSTTSKAAWARSLGYGCLNKSVGAKLRMYSHIRHLSTKLLAEPLNSFQFSYLRHPVNKDDDGRSGRSEIEGHAVKQEEGNHQESPPLSVVIIEDFSKPPGVGADVAPRQFTSTEFFNFLQSDKWGGDISLRLVGGELVDLLLTALYSLERQHRINSKVICANLNSRIKSSIIERCANRSKAVTAPNLIDESVKKAFVSLPKPYEPNQEFVYEKMNVEIIFYEKLEASNIPYVIQDTDKYSELNVNQPAHRDMLRGPYSLKQHVMNYVRLPPNEDVDQCRVIEALEAELEDLRNTELFQKELTVPASQADKASVSVDKIDSIADDPYLVLENLFFSEPGKIATKGVVAMNVKTSLDTKISSPMNKMGEVSTEKPSMDALERVSNVQIPKISSEEFMNQDLLIEGSVKSLSTSTEGSFTIIKSPHEIMSEDEEEPVFKRLNLTRNELYVTNLYGPRISNKMSTKKKLNLIQQLKMKERHEREQKIYEKLKERVSFDIQDRFKCLVAKKEEARIKATAPQIENKITVLKGSKSIQTNPWNEYSQSQEEVEMDSALINQLEKNVLERMLTCAELKSAEKKAEGNQESKSKSTKNKTKNNANINNDSSFNSNKDTQLNHENLQSNNSDPNNANAMKKTITKCIQKDGSISKLKFPLIEGASLKFVDKNKHKITSSTVLPLLSDRKNRVATNIALRENKRDEIFHRKMHIQQNDHKTTNSSANAKTEVERNYYKLNKQLSTISVKEKQFQQYCNYSECLLRKQNMSNFNINQNRATMDENADKESWNSENITDQSKHTLDSSSVEHKDDRSDTRETPVDLSIEQLKPYNCECTCVECIDLANAIGHGEDCSVMSVFPPFLGRMRRDFSFLNCYDNIPKSPRQPRICPFGVPKISNQFVCDIILNMLDTTMIRKEIVTSSLGYTYVTITFTRQEVLNN